MLHSFIHIYIYTHIIHHIAYIITHIYIYFFFHGNSFHFLIIIGSHMFQLVALLLDLACCEIWFRLTGIGIRSRLLAVDLAAKRSAAVDRAVSQAIATSVTRTEADESYTVYL